MIEKKAQAGQENYRLKLQSDIDFNTYAPSAQVIEYMDSDDTTPSEWTASVLTGSETDGIIYHDFGTGANAVPAEGPYKVRCKLTIAGKIVYTATKVWIVGGM